MGNSAHFAPANDDDNAKIRNDALVDTMLEFTLLDIRSKEMIKRLAEHFLAGTFFIPTERPTDVAEALAADDVSERFQILRIQNEGGNNLPLCTDISSLSKIDGVKDNIVMEGRSAARFAITQPQYDGVTFISNRMDDDVTFPIKILKSMLGIR